MSDLPRRNLSAAKDWAPTSIESLMSSPAVACLSRNTRTGLPLAFISIRSTPAAPLRLASKVRSRPERPIRDAGRYRNSGLALTSRLFAGET